MNNIEHKTFAEIDLQDSFFQSLRDDYPGFDDWFKGKSSQDAFVQYENNKVIGFLYLKVEQTLVDDVVPNIHANKILKIGTFKINAHGTKMGEQFIKIIMDYAVNENVGAQCTFQDYKEWDYRRAENIFTIRGQAEANGTTYNFEVRARWDRMHSHPITVNSVTLQ